MMSVIRLGLSDAQWLDLDGRLRHFIKGRIASPDDADDILQDSYQSMQQRIEQLKDGERFEAWLYTIVRNKIIDFYRKRKKNTVDVEDVALVENADESVMQELAPCLSIMIKNLDDIDQEALSSIHLHNNAVQDFADQYGLSLSAAKSRVQRARKKMRSLFEDCCGFQYNENGQLHAVHQKACTHCETDTCH